MMRRTRIAFVLALCLVVVGPHAQAATYPAHFARAVAYWYLPTDAPDVYRHYRLEVVQAENVLTGHVSTTASIVTDRCTEQWVTREQMILACGDGRRERVTDEAELVVSPDLSAGVARLTLGVHEHVIRFTAYARPQRGVFERDRRCSEVDRTLVAGNFSNMETARGRLLGQKLGEPYRRDLDHAWLESGYGAWWE